MKIVITGATGRVGRHVVALGLEHGHQIVATDIRGPTNSEDSLTSHCTFIQPDLKDFDQIVDILKGCDAVIHLAALIHHTHKPIATMSWSIMETAQKTFDLHKLLASPLIGLYATHSSISFDYFPVDEDHPCRPDDSHGVSKAICEVQADCIVRRYPQMRIALLRLHMVSLSRDRPINMDPPMARTQLWDTRWHRARAFLLAVTVSDTSFQTGHEQFFIVEPDVASDKNVEVLLEEWKTVPVRADIKAKDFLIVRKPNDYWDGKDIS